MASQYLDRVPASKAKPDFCYYCDAFLNSEARHNSGDRSARTVDHILAKSIGNFRIGKRPNQIVLTRPCCVDCNSFRADLGHCAGLLMMTIIEGQRRGIHKKPAAAIVGIIVSKAERRKASRQRRRERRDAKRVAEEESRCR